MSRFKDKVSMIEELIHGLYAEKVVQEEESEECGEYHTGWNIPCDDPSHRKIIQPEIREADTQRREFAKKRLNEIYRSYLETNAVRYIAGRGAGISSSQLRTEFGALTSLKVWAHDHPTLATLTGIAIAAATSGLVYKLVENYSK